MYDEWSCIDKLRFHEVISLSLLPCEKCGEKMKNLGTGSTMAGIHKFYDKENRWHIHDRNRKTLHMRCSACDVTVVHRYVSKCSVQDCDDI